MLEREGRENGLEGWGVQGRRSWTCVTIDPLGHRVWDSQSACACTHCTSGPCSSGHLFILTVLYKPSSKELALYETRYTPSLLQGRQVSCKELINTGL